MTPEKFRGRGVEPVGARHPSPGQTWHFEAVSPDASEALARPLDARYLQLGRGRFRQQVQGVFLDGVLVVADRLETPVHFRGGVIPNAMAFQCFESAAPVLKEHLSLLPHSLAVSQTKGALDLTSQAPVQACSVFVREERWHALLRGFGAEQAAEITAGVIALHCSAGGIERFRRRAHWSLQAAALYPDCFQQPQIRGIAEIGLAASILDLVCGQFCPAAYSRSAARRRIAVAEVDAYIREHFDEPLTLIDLCRIGRLQMRALQYAFRERFGLSPMAYLKRVRLDQARRSLRAADPRTARVTTIALEVGFWHFSQFAQDYRMAFGESPSVTLRQRLPAVSNARRAKT